MFSTSMTGAVITRYTIAFFLLILSLSVDLQADVYTCVIDGVTTYSDSPCGSQAKRKSLSAGINAQRGTGKQDSQERRPAILQVIWQSLNDTWFFALALIVIIVALLKTPKVKGMFGESVVNLLAKIMLDKDDYHLIKNVTLRTGDGTTQIDHVIISKYGIFVVETKNMKGWIFGSPNQNTWTQKIYKSTSKFQNPLHQNYKHVRALASLLGIPEAKFYSVVAFVGESTFKTPMPENVTQGRGWVRFVKARRRPMLSDRDVKRIIREIEAGRLARSMKTNREHVAHVKNIKAGKQNRTTCPKCGSPLIIRETKNGANAGSQFYGCSSYPNCRFTQAVNG